VYRSIQFDSFQLSALGNVLIEDMVLITNTNGQLALVRSEVDVSTLSLLGKRLKIDAESSGFSYSSKDISAAGDLVLQSDLAIDTATMTPSDGTFFTESNNSFSQWHGTAGLHSATDKIQFNHYRLCRQKRGTEYYQWCVQRQGSARKDQGGHQSRQENDQPLKPQSCS
jgi:hypothetical protein